LAEKEIGGDLFEMMAAADPILVKTVKRQAHYDMLISQITGLAASVGALTEVKSGQEADLAESIRRDILRIAQDRPLEFERKIERAAARYVFLDDS
jgi:hypothetical protein